MKIKPKKWDEFQHYRDRSPSWIKLHRRLLDDVTFQRLPRASQALAPMLWLVASECEDGIIDANPEDLAFRLRWPEQELQDALSPLIGKGFFDVVQFDSKPLAEAEQPSRTEKRREETEKETTLSRSRGTVREVRKAQIKTEALQFLDFLNAKAGKHFRPVPSNLRFIEARLAEGVPLQDLKTLTIRKCREWLGTDMEKFLRPETLCGATKCHSYLGEIPEEPCNAQAVNAPSESAPKVALAAGPHPTPSELH